MLEVFEEDIDGVATITPTTTTTTTTTVTTVTAANTLPIALPNEGGEELVATPDIAASTERQSAASPFSIASGRSDGGDEQMEEGEEHSTETSPSTFDNIIPPQIQRTWSSFTAWVAQTAEDIHLAEKVEAARLKSIEVASASYETAVPYMNHARVTLESAAEYCDKTRESAVRVADKVAVKTSETIVTVTEEMTPVVNGVTKKITSGVESFAGVAEKIREESLQTIEKFFDQSSSSPTTTATATETTAASDILPPTNNTTPPSTSFTI